jgi:hypothetical protein
MPLDRLDTIKQAVIACRESVTPPPTLEEDMDDMCISVFGGREVEACELSCEM